MMYGVIDLGSNTIRLTTYRVKGDKFKILFAKKTTAGLAGYVKDGALTQEGINIACEVLTGYKAVFENFDINHLSVFATASLRNINNTQEAVDKIKKETGFSVEVLSGEEEATLDFAGATRNVNMDKGILVDIGGGSTELVTYKDSEIIMPFSMPEGSLSLYNKCVEKILPKKTECKKMSKVALQELDKVTGIEKKKYSVACGVGGTIRAVLKLNNYLFSMPSENNQINVSNLRYIVRILSENDATTRNLLLKVCPDRIHTIIPGMYILMAVVDYYQSELILVSNYGVREGYLFEKIVKNDAMNEEVKSEDTKSI